MRKHWLFIMASLLLSACGASGLLPTGGAGGDKPKIGDTVVFKTGPVTYNEGKIEKIDGGKSEIRAGDTIAKPDLVDVYAMPKAGSKTDVKVGDIVIVFNYQTYWTGGEVKNVTADLIDVEQSAGGKLSVAPDKIIKVTPTAIASIKQSIDEKAFQDLGKTKMPVLPKDWKPKAGEKVAAQWSFGSWHVAVIKHVNANNIDILWQNGWKDGTVAKEKIAPYPTAANAMPKVGDYVIVKPQTDTEEWKFATVSSVSGDGAEVKFADGKTQKVKVTEFITMS